MFVKSNMEKEVRFNKGGNSVLIKPKTVTYIADNLGITPQDLLNCYGSRISIMSRKLVETVIQEEATKCPEPKRETEVKEPQVPQPTKETKVETPQPTKETKVETPQPTKEPEVKKQPAKSVVKSAVKKASGKTGVKRAVKTKSNK